MSKTKNPKPLKITDVPQRQASIAECFNVISQACELAPIPKVQHQAVEAALIRVRGALQELEQLKTAPQKKK